MSGGDPLELDDLLDLQHILEEQNATLGEVVANLSDLKAKQGTQGKAAASLQSKLTSVETRLSHQIKRLDQAVNRLSLLGAAIEAAEDRLDELPGSSGFGLRSECQGV